MNFTKKAKLNRHIFFNYFTSESPRKNRTLMFDTARSYSKITNILSARVIFIRLREIQILGRLELFG